MPIPILRQSDFIGRSNFGDFLNRLEASRLPGFVLQAVEVGTNRGEFALQFLKQWHGSHLWCIDPFLSGYSKDDPVSQSDREQDRIGWSCNLRHYIDWYRCLLMPITSEEGSKKVPDGFCDFVYIDANHEPPHPYNDLCLWYPKVRSGGVLAGHDFACSDPGYPWTNTVRPAVERFAVEHGLTIFEVMEPDGSPSSFYFIKP